MEEKLRTFIALELGQKQVQTLATYTQQLQNKFPSGFRWVKPGHMHLTLKFFGEISPKQVETVSNVLAQFCLNIKPFNLRVEGYGAFPNWRNPRTIWAGLTPVQEVQSLHHQIDEALAQVGFQPEGRRFSPHLTLCRVSDYVDQQLVGELEKAMQTSPIPPMDPWEVKEVVFIKSRLQPGGPVYTPLAKFEFNLKTKV